MDLNVGIVGPGGIAGDQHAPALARLDGMRLWSVCGRDAERTAQFARRHGAAANVPAFTDLRTFLADPDLDAIIIATPDRQHAEQAISAAKSGKHILLEKPMATDVASASRVIAACEENGVILAMAYHLRWHAGHRLLRHKILNGVIGDLLHIRLQWTFRAPDGTNWRSSPETGRWWSLAANGTHCLDLARWFMSPSCGEVENLMSLTSSPVWGSVHDESAIVALRFESGATAEIVTSVLFDSEPRIEIYGSNNSAICTNTLGRHGAGEIRIGDKPLMFEPENPFMNEIADFHRAIVTGTSPEVDAAEGMTNIELLIRAAEAATTSKSESGAAAHGTDLRAAKEATSAPRTTSEKDDAPSA
jgi:predicted dehydrogenase